MAFRTTSHDGAATSLTSRDAAAHLRDAEHLSPVLQEVPCVVRYSGPFGAGRPVFIAARQQSVQLLLVGTRALAARLLVVGHLLFRINANWTAAGVVAPPQPDSYIQSLHINRF